MRLTFDTEKAVQAAGVLLRHEPLHRMTRLRLLKLLYIADRRVWQERGRPLLRAKACALDHGPIHSEVYDLIKGTHIDEPKWSTHFRSQARDVVMDRETEVDRLSSYEIQTLLKVSEEFAEMSDWELSKYTHSFGEFQECYVENTSRQIPIEKIIAHTGRAADAESIISDLRASEEIDRKLRQVQV